MSRGKRGDPFLFLRSLEPLTSDTFPSKCIKLVTICMWFSPMTHRKLKLKGKIIKNSGFSSFAGQESQNTCKHFVNSSCVQQKKKKKKFSWFFFVRALGWFFICRRHCSRSEKKSVFSDYRIKFLSNFFFENRGCTV